MRSIVFCAAATLLTASLSVYAKADTVRLGFAGPTVSGSVVLTYGTATDATYPQAFEVTGASGEFSDTTLGISNATITGLAPLNRSAPEPTNLLAPNDFSRFPVAVGTAHGTINYDNLFYPGGSPQTATDYPFHGGPLDIYGVLFDIGNGTVVNFYSNGFVPGDPFVDYGVLVATSAQQLDSVSSGVVLTPEPESFYLLGTGLLGTLAWWRPRFLRMRGGREG